MKKLLLPLLFAVNTVFAADAPTPPADLKAPGADAQRSVTGLFTKQLAAPTGKARPTEDDLVKIRYTMWTSDGKLLDTIVPPKVALAPMYKMMPGVREALLMMAEGEKQRVWISENLGAAGRVPKGGLLVADLELVEIVKVPTTPRDVAAPPEDATKTRTGLAYKILRPGKGTKHPKDGDYVRVNYTGWTADGKMFDSTVMRGNSAEFGINNVIAGWTEGLKLMTEGESVRMWIPARLAYAGQAGKPQGMLVFDIELVDIE